MGRIIVCLSDAQGCVIRSDLHSLLQSFSASQRSVRPLSVSETKALSAANSMG
jgi:hypothetical protein